jgi:heme/copper-type cytochrome/quinol oxidase subunit 2
MSSNAPSPLFAVMTIGALLVWMQPCWPRFCCSACRSLPAVLALPADSRVVVHVTGKQFWWRVQYTTPTAPLNSRVHVIHS